MTEPRDENLADIDEQESLDGMDDEVRRAEQVAQERPYGEVMTEDLETSDLLDDGADLSQSIGEDDPDLEGAIPVDRQVEVDEVRRETIDDRIAQEVPDPATDIVPD
ncbi:hypothetical protein [Nigerium massiliense]|uniref:hypothetical protein n=1 Tax=Nigerium massiliense TaxID=1522317 RepID=UPI0005902983|nr:hypothetical protein [Nigerium massiliense]